MRVMRTRQIYQHRDKAVASLSARRWKSALLNWVGMHDREHLGDFVVGTCEKKRAIYASLYVIEVQVSSKENTLVGDFRLSRAHPPGISSDTAHPRVISQIRSYCIHLSFEGGRLGQSVSNLPYPR